MRQKQGHRSPPKLPAAVERRYQPLRHRLGTLTRDALLAFATILGGVAAIFFFLPRVTVEPSGPYDPAAPSPITFTIANTNIVPLRNVQPGIGLCSIELPMKQLNGSVEFRGSTCNGPATVNQIHKEWFVRWLDPDEKWQIALEDQFILGTPQQIEKANITVIIQYTPWCLPFGAMKSSSDLLPNGEVTEKSIGFLRRSIFKRREEEPMPRKPPAKPRQKTDPEQHKRFLEMAREVEVDERPEAFDRAFKKVVMPRRSAKSEVLHRDPVRLKPNRNH